MGKVWKYGDDVNTDVIFPGKYTYTIKDRAEMALHACSREQAATCLKERGIRAIVAKSFARIHYRNCLNEGLATIVCPEACDELKMGDEAEVDFERGVIKANGKEYPFPPYPEFVQGLINDGGLIPHVKKELGLA